MTSCGVPICRIKALTTDVGWMSPDFELQSKMVAWSTKRLRERLCGVNRNSKDFDDQNVVEELANWDCTLFPRFDSGLDFVRSRLD